MPVSESDRAKMQRIARDRAEKETDGHVFAIDLLRSIPADLLLEHVGRVTPSVAASVERVTCHIL